jgi:hypothetical protein
MAPSQVELVALSGVGHWHSLHFGALVARELLALMVLHGMKLTGSTGHLSL